MDSDDLVSQSRFSSIGDRYPGYGRKFENITLKIPFSDRDITPQRWIDWIKAYGGLVPMIQSTKVLGSELSLGKCTFVDSNASSTDRTNWQWEILNALNQIVGLTQFVQREGQLFLKITRTNDKKDFVFSINDAFCDCQRFEKRFDSKGNPIWRGPKHSWRAQENVNSSIIRTVFAMNLLKELGFIDGDIAFARFDGGTGSSTENTVILKSETKNKRKKIDNLKEEIQRIANNSDYQKLQIILNILCIVSSDIDWEANVAEDEDAVKDDKDRNFKLKVERGVANNDGCNQATFFHNHRIVSDEDAAEKKTERLPSRPVAKTKSTSSNPQYLLGPKHPQNDFRNKSSDKTKEETRLKALTEVRKQVTLITQDDRFVEKYKSLWEEICGGGGQWIQEWEEYKSQIDSSYFFLGCPYKR